MAAYVRCDLRHLYTVDLVVSVDHMSEAVLPMKGYFRKVIFIKIQEAAVAANHLLDFRLWPILDDCAEHHGHILCNRKFSGSCSGLGRLDDTLHVGHSLKLVIDSDYVVLEVDILNGKTAELGNTHSGMEQDVDCLVVLAVHVVIMYKLEELPHLVLSNRLPGHAVVYHNPGKLKSEWIFYQKVIVHCHLESRSEHTTHRLDGAVSFAIRLHLYQEQLSIRGLNLLDAFPAEFLLGQKVLYHTVVLFGAGLYSGLSGKVSFHQFHNRHIPASRVKL